MAINVDTFYQSVLNTSNKQRSGHLPPNRFNDFLNQASTELFNEKRLAAIQNQKIDDDLSPFLKSQNLPVTAPEGQNFGLVTRPTSEYTYFWNMRAFFSGTIEEPVSCGCPEADNSACNAHDNFVQTQTPIELLPIIKEVNVPLVDAGRWSSVLMHRTKYPTIDRPVATQYSGGFKIAPRNLNIVTLDNYRLPVKAIFGYIIVPNLVTGVPYYQYNAGTSTQIEWGEQVFDELLDRTLKLFSIYLRDPNLYQMSNELKATRV